MVAGRLLGRGSRVRLKPRPDGDALDAALAGRTAVIEGVEEDGEGATHVAVILDDDPGADLAAARHPAHRFFFAPEELDPVDDSTGAAAPPAPVARVLVAGIGNVFWHDDGFGSAVAQRLTRCEPPREIDVVDFGIRGMDLAYALGQPYDAAILVDTMARGGPAGTLYVMEPDQDSDSGTSAGATMPDSHRMDPATVLRLAGRLGKLPPHVLVVGCEPTDVAESESQFMELSAPVAAAVERAAQVVLKLAVLLLAARHADMDSQLSDKTREIGASKC